MQIMHMTSLHRDFVKESYNPYLPNNRELLIIFRGLIFGIVLLIVENVIKTYWKTEYETLKK
jgi:hypothetical protein